MHYKAAAAVPYVDPARAVSELRGQLRVLAGIDGATPDWPTLRVDGPVEVIGVQGRVWYEWTATVAAAPAGPTTG